MSAVAGSAEKNTSSIVASQPNAARKAWIHEVGTDATLVIKSTINAGASRKRWNPNNKRAFANLKAKEGHPCNH